MDISESIQSELGDKSPLVPDDLASLTDARKNFWLCENFEMEINSGGFSGYFYNAGGNFAKATIEALRFYNTEEFAKLLSEATALIPEGVLLCIDERQDWLDEHEDIDDKFNELGSRFYGCDLGTTEWLRIEYAINNPLAFFKA